MKKVYFNLFNNKAIIINETSKTFSLVKATDMKASGCFTYHVSLRRMIEIKNGLLQRSFTRIC